MFKLTASTSATQLSRSLIVELDRATWPKGVPASLAALEGRRNANVLDVLTEIGRRTAPPLSHGFTLSDRWAWLRYLPALDEGPMFRLRPEWFHLDSHQKTILSDDFGVGLPMRFLTEALRLSFITTTNYFLSQVAPRSGFLRRSGRRGPAKSPDFVCVDASGIVHVVECKGTQSDLQTLRGQLLAGVAQKENIVFTRARVGQSLVAGFFIPQHGSSEEATLRICDPEGDTAIRVDLSSREVANIVMRGELASTLHLLGLPTFGNRVATMDRRDRRSDESVRRELSALQLNDEGARVRVERFTFSAPIGELWESVVVELEVGITEETLEAALTDENELYERFADRSWQRDESPDSVRVRSPLGLTTRARILGRTSPEAG